MRYFLFGYRYSIFSTVIFRFLIPFGNLIRTVKSGSNLTFGECISIERVHSVRRSSKSVNAVENNPAYLHCAIGSGAESLDYLVAWTRLKDDALLTAGGRAFTSDARFQISPKRQTRDWVLLIRRVQKSDEGCYLCEINTEPLSTLIPVFLNVIPVQEIPKRSSTSYSKEELIRNANLIARMEGDSIILNCTIGAPSVMEGKNWAQKRHTSVGDLMWTKDNIPIKFDGGQKYSTFVSNSVGGAIIHILRISDISSSDDGLYGCEGENIARSAQMVHVNASNGSSTFNNLSLDAFSLFLKLSILLLLQVRLLYVYFLIK